MKMERTMVSRITNNLYIGDWLDAQNLSKESGFDRVISVCQNATSEATVHLPIEDAEYHTGDEQYGMFAEAVDRVRDALERDEKVFIHCHAGQSRSVAVSIAALATHEGVSYDTARKKVSRARGMAVAPELSLSAKTYIIEEMMKEYN